MDVKRGPFQAEQNETGHFCKENFKKVLRSVGGRRSLAGNYELHELLKEPDIAVT